MKPETDIRTVKTELELDPEQLEALRLTAGLAEPVFKFFAELACERHSVSYQTLHKHGYQAAKLLAPDLPTGLLQNVAKSACAAVRSWNTNNPKRKWQYQGRRTKTASLPLNVLTLSRRGRLTTFSTAKGRLRVIHDLPEWFFNRYTDARLQAGQIKTYADGKTVLFLQYKITVDQAKTEGQIIGLDRGLYRLYTSSTGEYLESKPVIAVKRRRQYQRSTLQQKGTRSARRKLKLVSGREKRFMVDVNHCVTRHLAVQPGVKTYVLEKLKGMRTKRRGTKLNSWLSNWSWFGFETLLGYKCKAKGISVEWVPAAYTSQKCSCCGHTDPENRNRSRFLCRACGHRQNADLNAARNIRDDYAKAVGLGQGVFNHPNDNKSCLRGLSIHRPCAGGS
jgi:putative transposase